jgi:hypothetical protein
MIGDTPSLPGRWESPVIPLPTSGAVNLVFTHGRSVVPTSFQWRRVCLKPDLGYQAGDETETTMTASGGNQNLGWANAVQVGFLANAVGDVDDILRRDTQAQANLTAGSWGLKVYCTW